MNDWLLYRGGEPHSGIAALPPAPAWRAFDAEPGTAPAAALDHAGWRDADLRRAAAYRPRPELLRPVNAALYLRRPLLITGRPGSGKSTLAYAVAYELGLGPVLRWPVTSRTTLAHGLYDYDAIGRLQDANLFQRTHPDPTTGPDAGAAAGRDGDPVGLRIGRYIRLGPLGTALLPGDTPRVLLVDEIDKADIDLPNDLLNVFEEGEYEIPELSRIADVDPVVEVGTADTDGRARITAGRVRCRQFPLVMVTSNGERDFPPAFLRRCLRIDIGAPTVDELGSIVRAHLGEQAAVSGVDVIRQFSERARAGELATDQLLNAVQLTHYTTDQAERDEVVGLLLQYLDTDPGR